MATAARPPFVDHCLELLAPLGAVHARRMFGGWGLYADDLFVALIAGDRLYLKADAAARPLFADAGAEAFVFDAAGKQTTTGYWSAPDDAMDSPAAMAPWARLALHAVVAARAGKAVKRPTRGTKPVAGKAAAKRTATARRPRAG